MLALPRGIRPGVRNMAETFIRKWNGREELQWFFPSTIVAARRYYAPNLFEELGDIRYCGKQYSCVKDPDAFLRVDYGDYMQLPPEEERVWAHHPILIDFERNYEELIRIEESEDV